MTDCDKFKLSRMVCQDSGLVKAGHQMTVKLCWYTTDVQRTEHFKELLWPSQRKITMGSETSNDQDYQYIKVDRMLSQGFGR